MATAGAGRLLSDLPDDVLRRILFLVPGKEAASAALLSRRWRSLWRTSGAVYLDSRSFYRRSTSQEQAEQSLGWGYDLPWGWDHWESERESFIHGAEKALAAAAAAVPIKRLTLVFKFETPGLLELDTDQHLIGPVVSNPAARRVEELHVEVGYCIRRPLGFGSLPSEALRVLRLVSCRLLAGGGAFPSLAELHLRDCTFSGVGLQGIADAAPQLATLHLESSYLSDAHEAAVLHTPPVQGPRSHRLVFPAVTALMFVDCSNSFPRDDDAVLELDVPRLQSLKYKGAVQRTDQLSLKTPSGMIHVDLHLVEDYNARGNVSVPILFWQFIKNLSTTMILKVKLDFSMDRVAPENQDELVCKRDKLFHNLERLELDAQYSPASEATFVVLATLLHSCPVVRDLRLELSKGISWMRYFSIDQEARADFDNSVNRFRHRRSPTILLGGQGDHNYETFDMPVLSKQSFSCLQSCLRRVSLHFCMEPVQLAKFFAKEAMVLEELNINDGSQKMREHLNNSVRIWTANSAKKKDLANNVVLALEAWNVERGRVPRSGNFVPKRGTGTAGNVVPKPYGTCSDVVRDMETVRRRSRSKPGL
ncbi:unnamed protein product [Urochloa decumbens]|uniref:F-box domain-containing protein n=1 Tax=Urochloa decumbens TaxID=240449 RepID=A0ABC9AZV2_9POAL